MRDEPQLKGKIREVADEEEKANEANLLSRETKKRSSESRELLDQKVENRTWTERSHRDPSGRRGANAERKESRERKGRELGLQNKLQRLRCQTPRF